jgi:outer membrane protein, multidrug efflux system
MAKLTIHIIFITFNIFSLFFLASCNIGPQYEYPKIDIPEEWKRFTAQEREEDSYCNWWEIFKDEKLNELIEMVLANNYNLKAATQRIIQARAQSGIAASNLYPQITLNPSYSNEVYLTKAYGINAANQAPKIPIPLFREHLLAYMLPLNLSWEIDLWGELRNIYYSAVYEEESQEDLYEGLALIITTDLADRYFRLRSADQQIDLYLTTIATREKALKINQDRYDSKIINYDAVSQAELDLANVEADYFESKRVREQLENSIATLAGVPSSLFFIDHNPLVGDPPLVMADLPSVVMLQRPDLRSLERQRASDHALVKAAYGAFFPAFSLTGALGYSSPDLRHFLSWCSRYWEIGAGADQTVYDGGRLCSNLKLQWAKFHEADDDYKNQVLTALEEVNSSLSDIEWFSKESAKLEVSVKAASTTYRIAYDRYFEGIGYYLPVVDAERDELNAKRSLNNVQGLRYSAAIQLIKALGGTW